MAEKPVPGSSRCLGRGLQSGENATVLVYANPAAFGAELITQQLFPQRPTGSAKAPNTSTEHMRNEAV